MTAPWCIGAGAIRNLVWDHLHGFLSVAPDDVDLVFFDPRMPPEWDTHIALTLKQGTGDIRWDVVNQAHVHTWNAIRSPATPFGSLEDAMRAWPETATAVGVNLGPSDELQVVAPLGLEDLFGLFLRPSPYLRNPQAFTERVSNKQFQRRWPNLRLVQKKS